MSTTQQQEVTVKELAEKVGASPKNYASGCEPKGSVPGGARQAIRVHAAASRPARQEVRGRSEGGGRCELAATSTSASASGGPVVRALSGRRSSVQPAPRPGVDRARSPPEGYYTKRKARQRYTRSSPTLGEASAVPDPEATTRTGRRATSSSLRRARAAAARRPLSRTTATRSGAGSCLSSAKDTPWPRSRRSGSTPTGSGYSRKDS